MTIDRERYIKIPTWIITLLIPIIVSATIAFGTVTKWTGKYETKSTRNEMEIEKLQQEKADQKEMDRVFNSLVRIETKLDNHIANTRDKN